MADVRQDAGAVEDVLRFGWAITELRGRYIQGIARQSRPEGLEHVIPLKWERTRAERAIEAKNTVESLATKLGFDKLNVTRQFGENAKPLDKLEERTGAIAYAKSAEDLEKSERALVTFIGLWEEAIQDQVVATSPSVDAAYQLARGLADVRWCNDLSAEESTDKNIVDLTWTFYLGPERREQLTHRLHTLADYFDPLAVHSMAASLWAWGIVADTPALRADEADVRRALKDQADIWRDLLIAGLPPGSMLTPEDLLKSLGVVWPVLKKYRWTIIAVAIGAIAAAVGVGLLTANASVVNRALGGFLAALGVIGITVSGVAARAKDAANGLLDQMRVALYQDLVAAASTILPAQARKSIKREQRGRDLRS
jgi:hypothetical protein